MYKIWKKKNWANVRETLSSVTYTYNVKNFWSKGTKNHNKVILVVDCRIGYKFEFNSNIKNHKIITRNLKFLR